MRGRLTSVLILMACAAIAAILWVTSSPRPAFSKDDPALDQPGDPVKGGLVFAAADCASCHATPGQSDRLKLGGGLALASPYGTFRPPNISPDPTDGIGSWKATDLANAMIGGISPRHMHYYPVFPYPSYTGMQVED